MEDDEWSRIYIFIDCCMSIDHEWRGIILKRQGLSNAILLIVCSLVACSDHDGSSGDWSSSFVIIDGYMYTISVRDTVPSEDIEERIGMVEAFSDNEAAVFGPSGISSNRYSRRHGNL